MLRGLCWVELACAVRYRCAKVLSACPGHACDYRESCLVHWLRGDDPELVCRNLRGMRRPPLPVADQPSCWHYPIRK